MTIFNSYVNLPEGIQLYSGCEFVTLLLLFFQNTNSPLAMCPDAVSVGTRFETEATEDAR